MAIIASETVGASPGATFCVNNHDGTAITLGASAPFPSGAVSTTWHITPDQARALAAALLSVAGPASLAEAA